MNMTKLPDGIKILAPIEKQYSHILTYEALSLLVDLHRAFEPIRQNLLHIRKTRSQALQAGQIVDFLDETKHIRAADWRIAPLPADLLCRRVEITGPVERKMVINALNSGADSYMSDFEDSNTPTWSNQLQGQVNLYDAVRHNITLDQAGKVYKLNPKIATLLVRPRGWHLDEKHLQIDGQPVSGSLFDFTLYFFHNAKTLLEKGSGPYFYLPKLESHLEARLWNQVFIKAQDYLSIPHGSIKATVLIETILAAFEMDEILYELRDHSAGLNAGRWDYLFSCIKKFGFDPNFCLAERGLLTMTIPFMRAYALLLLKTCHCRGAPAIGGMSALIPIKQDAEANQKAMNGVLADKTRDATDGYDGGWVAHPGLVPIAMQAFKEVLADKPNQIDKQRMDINVLAQDLLNFYPQSPITEQGLRMNINVAIHYLGSWLQGTACVPIHNLMEDAATAEICRSQVWQWIRSPKGILEDGRRISIQLVRGYIQPELNTILNDVGCVKDSEADKAYRKAAELFDQLVSQDAFTEFLTQPLYELVH